MVMAHQFIPQLVRNNNNTKIRDAVFGNVGSILAYKIGVDSAEVDCQRNEPQYLANKTYSISVTSKQPSSCQ
jgi:hypothetical protein